MPHPETLDYGPPPKRNLSVTPREWSGVLFILLAIPAGFLGLAMIIAAFVTPIQSEPQAEPTPVPVRASLVALGLLAELLCAGAILAAVRRLKRRPTPD